MTRSPLWLSGLSIGFLVLWLAVAAVPFLWTLWGSFKVEADFFSKQDWRFALQGIRTIAETGAAFTGAGYDVLEDLVIVTPLFMIDWDTAYEIMKEPPPSGDTGDTGQ